MDILAHSLWGFIVFNKLKNKFLVILFAVIPDLLSFGPLFLMNIITGTPRMGKPELSLIPDYVFLSYNLTHSLVVAFMVILAVYIITKKIHYFLLAWPLHIFIDIFTHTKEFFPTPFLYPLSEFKLSIISWANPTFMAINYGLIAILLGYILLRRKRKFNIKLNS